MAIDSSRFRIDRRSGREDLDVVLPMRRLGELAHEGVIGRAAENSSACRGWLARLPDVTADGSPDIRPPIAELLARKPWLLPRLYSGEIPDGQ